MKRSLALLLTSLLLVFSLAACGRDQQPGDVDDHGVSDGSLTGEVNNGGLTGGYDDGSVT